MPRRKHRRVLHGAHAELRRGDSANQRDYEGAGSAGVRVYARSSGTSPTGLRREQVNAHRHPVTGGVHRHLRVFPSKEIEMNSREVFGTCDDCGRYSAVQSLRAADDSQLLNHEHGHEYGHAFRGSPGSREVEITVGRKLVKGK